MYHLDILNNTLNEICGLFILLKIMQIDNANHHSIILKSSDLLSLIFS